MGLANEERSTAAVYKKVEPLLIRSPGFRSASTEADYVDPCPIYTPLASQRVGFKVGNT